MKLLMNLYPSIMNQNLWVELHPDLNNVRLDYVVCKLEELFDVNF